MRKINISLRELNPEAAEMWAYDLNGEMNPDNVAGKSEKEAYFRCLDNPNHVFKKTIAKMTSHRDGHNTGCIYCGPNAKMIFPGENDLLTLCAPAREMWDYELNTSLDPTKMAIKSSKKAYFKCNKGHSVYRKIADFYRSSKCPACMNLNTKMLTRFPNTRLFWDYKRNSEIDLKDVISSSSYNAVFSCPNCHYEWKAQVSHWNDHRYCPCCGYDGSEGSIERNKPLIDKNPLVTFRMDNPEGAAMWDYEANGYYTPDNILKSSNYRAHFICKYGHKFERQIYTMKDKNNRLRHCPECYKIKRSGKNDDRYFFEVCPEGKEMWDYSINEYDAPETIKSYSQEQAYFKCKKGHPFKKRISSFTHNPICPICDIEKNRSIAVKRPDMLKFWDFEKNTLSPHQTTPYSKEEVFWKCAKCGHEWKQKIAFRATAKEGRCPSCDLKRIIHVTDPNSFLNANPEAAKLWIDELNNGMIPANTSKDSTDFVYLKCINNPGHIYRKMIRRIPKESPYGCPYCLGRRNYVEAGKNDLFAICIQAKDMWDFDKNTGYDTNNINPKSCDTVWWKCNKGHEFQRDIRRFTESQNCPICKAIENCVAKYPHMVKQWHFQKNKGIDINLTSSVSKKTVWWKCKKCNYEWQAEIASRKASKGWCPCCENRTIIAEGITDLFTLVPQIKDSYDFEKNKDINVSSLNVSSSISVWWKCPTCKHEWSGSPASRIYVKNGEYTVRNCIICAGRFRVGNYADRYPELKKPFANHLNNCKLSEVSSSDIYTHFWWHCDICDEYFQTSLSSMIHSRNSMFKGCSYCAGKKVRREKSFAALHPDVMDEYAPNNTIDPYTVPEKSTRTVEWICRNNMNHKWKATFSQRAVGRGGCSICRDYNFAKLLKDEHPEFEKFYDNEKNERPFFSFSFRSNELVWWKCDEDHSFQFRISNLAKRGEFKCPICEDKMLVPGINDLNSQYPDLAAEFDITKNGLTPDQILSKNRNEDIWWICQDGHEFSRSVWYRVMENRDCPICNRSKIVKGINDFQTAYPAVTKVWNYSINDKHPDEFSDRHRGTYSFKCNLGHIYNSNLLTMIDNKFECLVCLGKIIQPGVNTLLDTDADLATEISPNEERSPLEFTKQSAYAALWKCPTCKGEYQYAIRDRSIGDDSCPYCTNRKLLPGFNTLDTIKNELIPEWSPNNERPMSNYFITSSSPALWICPTCNGEYSAVIREREVGDDSCPYCNNRKVLPGFNSLDVIKKELIPEWSSNNERSMSDYLPMSSSTALWICPTCNGEYPAVIREREVGDDSCPYCSERKVLPGYNSFATKHSDLLEEWDYINNYLICNPDTILDKNNINVWWICKECHKHYSLSVNKKLYYQKRRMKSCSYCKGRRRKKKYFF